jgi:pyruvate,water dikinase
VERPPAGIEWLGATEGDLRVVGGKAASLDRLARLGFRIPPGFCVTTAAFHAQLAAIPGGLEAVAALPDESARVRLTSAFESTAIDPGLRASLDAAIARLVDELVELGVGAPLFAVRSSGIGEDGTAASYAGLHETELGVAPAGIEAAVRRCWASLWSPSALAYRVRRELPLDGGGMAVVVQSLVAADASAVVFTRHPVTRTDDIVITAVRGLGESMVAGTVTPDTLVLDRRTLELVDFAPGDRGSRLVASDGGGVVEVPDPAADAALDGALLGDLAELALRVEGGFGVPVDIEAAAAGGRWFLLQARPITTS